MASKFRLNRYNWFGQKLLAQHEYDEIIRMSQYLACPDGSENPQLGATIRRQTSDHFTYLHGLALMKTSTHLDEIIFSLQRLNFDKNNQYFLLLCNCLLYSGNYDSVVALCKQVISKEIDTISGAGGESGNGSGSGRGRGSPKPGDYQEEEDELLVNLDGDKAAANEIPMRDANRAPAGYLDMVVQESFEFKKIFDNINRNHLINEPRLWFTFGLCLEYQRQLRDAHFAFRVAAKLASGNGRMVAERGAKSSLKLAPFKGHQLTDQLLEFKQQTNQDGNTSGGKQVSMSNYHAPHMKFAKFCIKHKGDFRSAIQVLSQGRQLCPHNYGLNSMLALCLSGQPMGNQANYDTAAELISSLEAHSITNRNPSSGYNRLVLKCMQKLRMSTGGCHLINCLQTGDEDRQNLDYLLAKAYVVVNSLVQGGGDQKGGDSNGFGMTNRLDKLIETLRNSGPACRLSASLWNNLGLCYLIKRRFIACFSCLAKANQISPLDWRINYNLAIVCVHVGLFGKAIMCLLASKSLYASSSSSSSNPTIETNKTLTVRNSHPLITSLLAICYEKLEEIDESRRLHIESIRLKGANISSMPIVAIVNYLIFLHKKNSIHQSSSDDNDGEQQHVKLKLHLLDQLEHCWLQRSQNDPQFSGHILQIAQLIGEETLARQNHGLKKSYAWTKSLESIA